LVSVIAGHISSLEFSTSRQKLQPSHNARVHESISIWDTVLLNACK